MIDTIGWIGSIMFAICGAPQAFKSIRDGHSRGISPFFLTLWLGGELCYLYSTIAKFGLVDWLLFNYIGNVCAVLIIGYYWVRPRKSTTL